VGSGLLNEKLQTRNSKPETPNQKTQSLTLNPEF
jgi:hypothetical protein